MEEGIVPGCLVAGASFATCRLDEAARGVFLFSAEEVAGKSWVV